MIERVETRMPVQVQWPIVEVNDVHGRDAALTERQVVVFDSATAPQKTPPKPQILGLPEDDGVEPLSRVRIAMDVEVSVCEHVHHDHGTNLCQHSLACEFRHKVTASIKTVAGGPLLQGFLAIEENEPIG